MEEFALGIADKKHYPELPTTKNKIWHYVVQNHDAVKRGPHKDLRLGNPETGYGHSWAIKELPKPGEQVYAIEQPKHSINYFSFQGEIPSGYGAGKVTTHEKDKVEIVRSEPGHVNFNVYKGYGPEEYTLHRLQDKMWKLYNRTKTKEDLDLPLYRPDYRETKLDQVVHFGDDYLMSAKIDDAHQLFVFDKDRIRSFSYRESKKAPSGLIEHTHKLDLPAPPKEFKNSIIRGGIFAVKEGRPVANAIIGGMLNSNVWKSREQQKVHGKLKPIIYDVDTWKGKDVTKAPYKEKLKILAEVNKSLPEFSLPDMAIEEEDKKKLLNKIISGEHPETTEGVVLWNLHNSSPPIKAKIFQDHDVYVKDFFAGEGKYKGKGVGGFTFSHSENGPVVGKVGTGLSDALRIDMHNNPEKYKGLVATVSSMEKYEKGALRAPSFKHWHESKNDITDEIVRK